MGPARGAAARRPVRSGDGRRAAQPRRLHRGGSAVRGRRSTVKTNVSARGAPGVHGSGRLGTPTGRSRGTGCPAPISGARACRPLKSKPATPLPLAHPGTEAGGVLIIDRRKPLAPLLRTRPHTAPVCALRLGPAATAAAGGGGSKSRLASASDDCPVCLLAAHDLRREARLAAHDDFARCVGWLAAPPPGGGTALLSGGWDKRLMRHTLQL